jgi:hypothetical protein
MEERKRVIGVAGRVAALALGTIIFAALVPPGGLAATQKATRPSTSQEASPKQIQELMTLLSDPKVRNWLEEQSKAEAASERAATEEPLFAGSRFPSCANSRAHRCACRHCPRSAEAV